MTNGGMEVRNLSMRLAYDGTRFHGFQRQPVFHGPTVQGVLEEIWEELVGEKVSIATAGRTDAGVHAAGQVISFFSQCSIPVEKIPKAFNSLLPRDIRILKAADEREDFHARLSARWKRYDYTIDNSLTQDVFHRLYSLHEPVPLNFERMKEAAGHLQGKHNFMAFAAAGGSSKTFERTLYHCLLTKEKEMIKISCVGDGFLYNMVRIIAGTLLDVGKGKIQPDEIPGIISARNRKRAGQTALPQGLTLAYVHYGPELPEDVFPDLR